MERQSRYHPVTPEVVAELKGIVGAKNVVYDDRERLEPLAHDETPDPKYAHMPEAAVWPESAEQIAEILKLANRRRIPVTPRGAGSGLSGGAVPLHGGIVLLTDRMNRILEIDRQNMMMVVEPGVVTNEINERLKEFGLWYAGYPMSLETCYIGGNVAENAGGAKAVKYGVTARYVLGLEVVSPRGEILHLGGKLLKDVTGYNLTQLMVGSEGTLGIFTKIILKLMPLPKASVDMLCLFASPAEAIGVVPAIMTGSGVIPTALEFLDRTAAQAACEYLNESIPYQQAGAMLLMTIDGADEEQVTNEYEKIGEQCLAAGAIEVYVADNPTNSERIWKVRRNIGEAIGTATKYQTNEDLVVPIAAIPQLVAAMEALGKKYGLAVPCYGHAGDGNMHTRILKNPDWPEEKWAQTLPKLLQELYEVTASLGGKVSGEHGIGHKRKEYLPMFVSAQAIEMFRAVKRALDPNNILNPGKIVDL